MVFQLGDRRAGLLSGDDFFVSNGRGPVYMNSHHTSYGATANESEVSRIELESDERFEITRLEVQKYQGGTDPDFTVDFYDDTAGEVLVQASDQQIAGSEPLATSSTGAVILVRVTNDTGDSYSASIMGLGFIRDA